MDNSEGVTLGRLLLALDRTLATLVDAPRGLDLPVTSIALVDLDDVHYGLGRAGRAADLHLLLGLPDEVALDLLTGLAPHPPAAVLLKSPTARLVDAARRLGVAVIAIDPHARTERIYNLILRVLDTGPVAGESMRAGSTGDLFELAGALAQRTGGLVSIEDERSHVLAYSPAGDAADELRRLSILGREGPPRMLAWLRRWGVLDALRTSSEVISVDEHADLGLRPRRAIAIRTPGPGVGEFLGVVWLQQGREPLAADTDDALIGAASVAARVITRRRAAGTEHDDLVQRLLGVRGPVVDVDYLAGQLGLDAAASSVVVAFGMPTAVARAPESVATQVAALTLHASAFSPRSVTTIVDDRAYVIAPGAEAEAAVGWARGTVAATERQFGIRVRAVVAGPGPGLAQLPGLRGQADRVLDAAGHQHGLIDDVTTIEASRTGVLLGEIVGLLADKPDLVDPRVVALADLDARTGSAFTESLRVYLDRFGDVAAAADELHVHPNTLRHRIRRLQALTGIDLDDPAARLVVALSLRAPRQDKTSATG
ncbi:helix-turn-helix domain-containing protein [Gordonia sp. ABSL1-1]|uniref:PucR family transcriptional regulator n=1 Tax=Gordonia sp. ABSL1-1 TaxID=3053923 RepID=UPI00257292BC|nr:helix-turn-helix domain-containing protein [Gordonia sp. ABSL1-1]MDL9938001.1 helix-turn-helix domain-containing protein [Gordonia sp. ABSL1-1]